MLIDTNSNYDYEYAGELTCKIEGLRQTARSVLSEIADIDIKAMSLLSEKMQKYKDEILKIRNKKNLSAYIKTGIVRQAGLHYDCKK